MFSYHCMCLIHCWGAVFLFLFNLYFIILWLFSDTRSWPPHLGPSHSLYFLLLPPLDLLANVCIFNLFIYLYLFQIEFSYVIIVQNVIAGLLWTLKITLTIYSCLYQIDLLTQSRCSINYLKEVYMIYFPGVINHDTILFLYSMMVHIMKLMKFVILYCPCYPKKWDDQKKIWSMRICYFCQGNNQTQTTYWNRI